MDDKTLERDGYSERPPLFRALALALAGLLYVFIDGGPRWAPVLFAVGSIHQWSVYIERRRMRLGIPRASQPTTPS